MSKNEQYQDWKNSRWQFTKSRSSWHFDPLRKKKPSEVCFTRVCRFIGDWREALELGKMRTLSCTWATRNSLDNSVPRVNTYCASEEEEDLRNVGADSNSEIHNRADVKDIPMFSTLAKQLGLEKYSIKLVEQVTGQMHHWHIDNFAGSPDRQNSFKVIDADLNPSLMRRFVIALEDWKHGQIYAIGNEFWTQWHSGDCITWDWIDMPHGTANLGWWPRYTLQITGETTPQTLEILAQKYSMIKINQ